MEDYKASEEGQTVRRKYADILRMSRPEYPRKHPPMTISNRAKIFSPFAALRGYEEEISDEGEAHLRIQKPELSDEDKAILCEKLLQIKKGMTVDIRYFKGDATAGSYEYICGTVLSIDSVYKEIRISTGQKNELGKELPVAISFDDIWDLQTIQKGTQ